MDSIKSITRRSFVSGAATGGTVAAAALKTASALAAAPAPAPARVRRAPSRAVGANDRLHIGIIGGGGNATGHMRKLMEMRQAANIEIIGVCEIYQKRLDAAAERTGGKPYKDYRKLLENPDIDYVLISVPEHWHARMTLDAADAGKHIYCEKPMTFTVDEGKKVVKKIKQAGVKMQVGVQGMSDDSYETARRYIKEGALGKVVAAQTGYSRNHLEDYWTRPYDEDVRPGENLDWKAFLGSAKKRPFDPDRFFAWRRYWDYSGGIATDLFVHRLTRILKACDLTVPSCVVATGGKNYFTASRAEIPDTFNMMIDYPEGISVVVLSSMANASKVRHVIRGHEATLEFTREGFVITPEKEFAKDRQPIVHTKTGAEDVGLHHQNLHRAIRLGEPLKCDAGLGFHGLLACRMAVDSLRKRRYLAWDARRQKVVKA